MNSECYLSMDLKAIVRVRNSSYKFWAGNEDPSLGREDIHYKIIGNPC